MSFPVALSRAVPAQRLRDLGLFAALGLWLVYTRLYWAMHAAHLSMPPCPFYYLTGHPCPFCGGTRSFAYMWEGDIADAVRLYPLGPALFAGTGLGMGGLAAGLVTGRTWSPRLTSRQWRLLTIFATSSVLISWALKVFVLGN
ncbi:MAG TPA: DUF2752 domain-containing protein [Candidatus Eisenbacteria bacterium]|nr:DUF2752 domain-containing protein [Candidatus Eisenbacteria bacterium]